jgi:Kdo2-lipid IVA lauroyltransferase/acyltransferase
MIQRKISNALLWLISLIPYQFGNYIHKFCTYLLKSVIKYRKSVIFKNLRLSFPEKNSTEITQIAHEYYKYLTAYLFETIHIYAKKNISKNIEFHNVALLNEALANGQSVMILGSHYGNWEWSSMLLPFHVRHDVYAIYKPLVNKSMDALVKEWRANFGLKLLAMDDVVKHLSKCKTPSVYIFVSDQRPANSTTGKWAKFLNQDTLFFEGASVLSKRYKAALVYQSIKVNGGRYEVDFSPIETEPLDYYVYHLENDIKAHPAPWLWSHNRWKFEKADTSI